MNYHNIVHDDMLNGDGLRVTLFVSGCSLHCKNCQNKQTWDKDSGIFFDNNAKQEIFKELEKDYISGITFSGGHPLECYNILEVTNLSKEIKEKFPSKTIWLYTGFVYENIKDLEIMKYIDVLVDGPYIDELRDISLQWKGSSNQRVIDINKTKEIGEIIEWKKKSYMMA